MALMALQGCGGTLGVPPLDAPPDPAAVVYAPLHSAVPPAGEVYDPQAVSALLLAVTGSPSDWRGGDGHGRAAADLPAATAGLGGWQVQAMSFADLPLLPDRHLRDTDAAAAWAQGWTGKGQRIGIIDDFENPLEVYLRLTVPRQVQDPSGALRRYDVTYQAILPTSHGAVVANIAGGDASAPVTSRQIDLTATAAYLPQCDTPLSCRAPPLSLFDAPATELSWRLMAGVAAEAEVLHAQVDLSATQDPDQTLAAVLAAVDDGSRFAALNLSIGFDLWDRSLSYAAYAADLTGALGEDALQNVSDAVIAIAAGNSGGDCGIDLWGCNAYAVAGTILPQTRDSVIIVGATSDAGGAEAIADYSTRAGVLQQRFMVASGQTGAYQAGPMGRLTEFEGTSFAAPRVAGAAAVLRQKFPDLSGADAASILLLSASKDIDGDGVAEFQGTSAIYGHGRLDLAAALSPIGTLAVR